MSPQVSCGTLAADASRFQNRYGRNRHEINVMLAQIYRKRTISVMYSDKCMHSIAVKTFDKFDR
jgi:hypothetical protein